MSFKQIKFMPSSKDAEQLVPIPRPTREYTPDWWNKVPAFSNGKAPKFDEGGRPDSTVKLCVPFADTLRFGYIQETWCDIQIERVNGSIRYFFASNPEPLMLREKTHLGDQVFDGYIPLEFAWKTQWTPRLPKGYSVMSGHPLNRTDLPFYTLSGIIDADKYYHDNNSNHPFLIKKDFEGIIPAGTPMYQIIPFKRDDWKSLREDFDPVSSHYNALRPQKKFFGFYKNNFWSKKTFK